MPKERCHECGSMSRTYVASVDAHACTVCDEWLEKKCGDSSCEFCTKRSESPSEILGAKEK